MASACLNNSPAISPSFTFFTLDDNPKPKPNQNTNPPSDPVSDPVRGLEGSVTDSIDFEFNLHDPVEILTADELFAHGKLIPLQLTSSRPQPEIRSPDQIRSTVRPEIALSDPSISSPKAPKCSSRWRDLLGLKRDQSPNRNHKSIKSLLNRNPRSSAPSLDPTMSLPLLRDLDSDSLSLSSSRLSLSSTSSSSDCSDLPRLSLDSDKPNPSRTMGPYTVRTRPVRRSAVDAESPRMNSSGKVVFYSGSLERSSSSPSSLNGGGSQVRAREMNRSFSANVVRIHPVLNVPVCKSGSVFGFFSGQKSAKRNVKMKNKERPSRE